MNPVQYINQAKELIKGKRLAKASGEIIPIKLDYHIGTNEYNTTIYLTRNDGGAFAYFCNGCFWRTTSGNKVELIA